jgi:dipeptidyl aminopeptidase/acylaminoacyl peptidase
MSKITHIPELIVHGDNDPTVPVERSRVMVAIGKKLGAEVKYIEVPGGDHGSVVAPNFPAVFEWFRSHKRKSGAAAAAADGSKN